MCNLQISHRTILFIHDKRKYGISFKILLVGILSNYVNSSWYFHIDGNLCDGPEDWDSQCTSLHNMCQLFERLNLSFSFQFTTSTFKLFYIFKDVSNTESRPDDVIINVRTVLTHYTSISLRLLLDFWILKESCNA
jgi:hypothetical protein